MRPDPDPVAVQRVVKATGEITESLVEDGDGGRAFSEAAVHPEEGTQEQCIDEF